MEQLAEYCRVDRRDCQVRVTWKLKNRTAIACVPSVPVSPPRVDLEIELFHERHDEQRISR